MTIEFPQDRNVKLKAALAAIDDRFRVIFDAVHDGIFITDTDTGRFIEINATGCEMFGYAKADLIGKDIALLSSGVAPYTLADAIMVSESAKPGEKQSFEWHCKNSGGELFWAEVSIRYALLDGLPVNISIVRDISERKRLDRELVQALGKAAAASEAKSAFLANMSHELRTPLNAVIGFSELILSEVGGAIGVPKYRDYIESIRSSGLHLLALINDILDLSRLDASMMVLEEKPLALGHVIADSCRMVVEQARRAEIVIVTDIPAGLPGMMGDERRVRQIVLNLLSNALKFTAKSGTITVRVQCGAAGLGLEVSDTGIGIARRDLPKVMERFAQIDNKFSRKYEGAGLGLPLVKQLAELHGGSVAISSKEGVGTVVTVLFPPERLIVPLGLVA